MIKNEKLYINNHKEFAHFSCLLFAPIFMPLKNGNLRKELKIENLKRTKYEYISYQGEQLNLNLDFKIYSLIASRAQSLQSNSITFTEKQLIRIGLGRSISSIIKSQIEQSLKVLQKSQFRIDKFDEFGNKVSGKYTSLVKSYEWNFAKKIINIEVESELINLDVCNFSKEKIYMDIVKSLRTDHEKALFLYLETRKFKTNKQGVNHNYEYLINRVAPNYSRASDKRSTLMASIESLKRIGYIERYDLRKTDFEEEEYIVILVNHSFVKQMRESLAC